MNCDIKFCSSWLIELQRASIKTNKKTSVGPFHWAYFEYGFSTYVKESFHQTYLKFFELNWSGYLHTAFHHVSDLFSKRFTINTTDIPCLLNNNVCAYVKVWSNYEILIPSMNSVEQILSEIWQCFGFCKIWIRPLTLTLSKGHCHLAVWLFLRTKYEVHGCNSTRDMAYLVFSHFLWKFDLKPSTFIKGHHLLCYWMCLIGMYFGTK